MTERSLEDALFHLRRKTMDPGVQKVVDEAAQLVTQGRHIEAAALIEKAEAMNTPNGHADAKAMNRVTEKLAASLAAVLAGAFQEMEDHLMDEGRKLNQSLQQQLEKLYNSVESLGELKSRFDHLAERVSKQEAFSGSAQEQFGRLSADVGLLRETGAQQGTEITDIRRRADQMSTSIDRHEVELSTIKAAFSEAKEKVAILIGRMDQQSEVIQSLQEAETRRALALEQALQVFAQLRTPLKAMAQSA